MTTTMAKKKIDIKYNTIEHLDYLTFSSVTFKPQDDVFGNSQECRPLIGNYNNAHIYDIGAIVQWHSDNPNLKTHVTLSGSTLDKMRLAGLSDTDITKWALGLEKSRIGRIDLAITSIRMDNGIHEFLPHFAHWITRAGWCETSLKLDKPVTDIDLNIETAYIGSRKKRNMLRVYDKGIDLGEAANRMIRIEMERRGGVAQTVANDVKQGKPYGAIINKYFSFPQVPVWHKLTGGIAAKRDRNDIQAEDKQAENNDKLWSWLMTSAAPALAKALANSKESIDNHPRLEEFNRIVEEKYLGLLDSKLK